MYNDIEWLLSGIIFFMFVLYESKTRKPIIPDLLYSQNRKTRIIWWIIVIWAFINFILLCVIK
jgi:hypothetical protein